MAYYAVLLVLLVFASPHIEARHSKFLTQPPAPSPAPTLAPVLAPAPAELEFGYGLYRHGSTITTVNSAVDDKESIVTGELASESYKEYNTDKSYNNNNNNNDVRYGYDTNSYSDKHYFEKGKYFYDTPKYRNYYQNGYEPVRRSSNNEGYYGNGENSKYVFNTMEEYKRQEGYPEIQREFIP